MIMKDLRFYAYPSAAPSLLAASGRHLGAEIKHVEKLGAQFIHIDVMDGRFVEKTTLFTSAAVKKISELHGMVNDVHLMVEDPLPAALSYSQAGADIVTFHYEASYDEIYRRKLIALLHSAGVRVGIAIKPLTSPDVLFPLLPLVDLILVMSVEPGRGGQEFIPSSLGKIARIKWASSFLSVSSRPLIEVDGGLNEVTGPSAVRAGASVLVAGSYLFGHNDIGKRMDLLVGREHE
jgi:ribulose-phosphate 3-epimerase